MKYLACITPLFVMAARRERRFSALVAFQRIEEAMENDTVDIDSQISDEEERLSDMEEEELQPNLVEESEESDESEEEATLPRIEDRIHEYRSPDGELWTTKAPRRGQTPARNLIRHRPGPTPYASARVHDEESSFLQIFDKKMIDTLVFETNREGRAVRGEDFLRTNYEEMKAYIGLCILRSVYKGHLESIDELFDEEHGRSIFRKTMTLTRFKELRRFLRFDNRATRASRLQRDKLAAVRLLLDGLTHSQQCYLLGETITIDEQLYSFRGRCRFIQYIPSKPAKYGLKFWCLNDSTSAYCWNIVMYTGKDETREECPLGEHVVLKLTEPLRAPGIGITTDNFFCSLSLSRKLLERNMTLLGTMRPNRREVPLEIRSHRGTRLHTSQFLYTRDNIQIVAYKAKKTKMVIVLSSEHCAPTLSNADNRKPSVIIDYNHRKGGTDRMDQMIASYTTKYKSRRWHVPVFCNILDIACLNAFVLHKELFPQVNQHKSNRRRLFLLSLGFALVRHQQESRIRAQELPASQVPRVQTSVKGRCFSCSRSADKKTRSTCSSCGRFICSLHSNLVCLSCLSGQ